MILTLPFPPSVNTYWRAFVQGKRVRKILSARGREYRATALAELDGTPSIEGRLAVHIAAYPPDRRKRDLDNLPKAVLDALQHAGVYEDDSQIDKLTIERMPIEKGGRVVVILEGM